MRIAFRIAIFFLLMPLVAWAQEKVIVNNFSPTFIENQGQWQNDFDYYYQHQNEQIYFEKNGWTILQTDKEDEHKLLHTVHLDRLNLAKTIVKKHSIKVRLLNSNHINPKGVKKATGYYNYFLGKNPANWRSKVPCFQEIVYYDIYSKINLIWKKEQTGIKYDYVIRKGGNIDDIQIQYQGINKILLRENRLLMPLSTGKLVEWIPSAFQLINSDTVMVKVQFVVKKNVVSFQADYNKDYDLVIDPKLIFSTYSGSKGDNFGYTATYDNDGNMFSGGIVDSAKGAYPLTAGAFQKVYGGGVGSSPVNLPSDVSISKYSSDGSTLLYATYIGGSNDEYPHSIITDVVGNLYIFGTTRSLNFPFKKDGYDTTHNGGYDIFVCKLSADGSKLLGSTYLGGKKDDGINSGDLRFNYADDFRGDIFVNNNNDIYVATCTRSNDFPMVKAFQSKSKGQKDACIFSLNSNLSKLKWSSYYGTKGEDAGYSIKQRDSFLYVGGSCNEGGLDTIVSTYQTKYNGEREGFVVKLLENDSAQPVAMTYFGTPEYDQVYFLDLDNDGRVYIAGQTNGTMTRTSGTYGKDDTKQFIAAFGGDLDTLVFSTTFGHRTTNPELSPSAFMVDNCYHIYYSGWGSTVDPVANSGTTKDLEISPDAIVSTTDNNDFYLLVLSPFATKLLHATFFGGTSTDDHVDGGTSRFDKGGVVYQSVCASCPDVPGNTTSDFPTTTGVAFEKNVSWRCSNACFKIDFNITYAVSSRFTASPLSGCIPLTINFINKTPKASTYLWDFGDGTTSTLFQPTHTFTKGGDYLVKLTVFDTGSCNKQHSQTIRIKAYENVPADFNVSIEPCSNEYEISIIDYDNSIDYTLSVGGKSYPNTEKINYKANFGESFNVKLLAIAPNKICKDSTEKTFTLDSINMGKGFVFNAFTPGTDGFNDCFELLLPVNSCEKSEFKIYNRWNQLVFKSSESMDCWNGKKNNTGAELPAGTYYYVLSNKEGKRINGSVTLIR